MANDFGAMTTRLIKELDRVGESSITARVQGEIVTAIKHYERERFWFNETTQDTSLSSSVAYIPVPSDVLALDSVEVTYNSRPWPLHRQSWDWYSGITARDTLGGYNVPTDYVWYGNRLYLYPLPASNYATTLFYLKQQTELTATADTNAWMTEGAELIRQRAKAAVKLNYYEDGAAKQEALLYAQKDMPFLSRFEEIAYGSLAGASADRTGTGRIKPTSF